MNENILKSYEFAKKAYKAYGVDADAAIEKLKSIPLSVHCWQADDIAGFEKGEAAPSQNVVTGNYPGKARNGDEVRADLLKAFNGVTKFKVNLHSIYAEPKTKKERADVNAGDFDKWIKFAKENGFGLDFNGSFFAHNKMSRGLSLSSNIKSERDYWVKHAIGCREISNEMGKALGQVCVHNIWVPDGLKDAPASRSYFRQILKDSLDEILAKKYDRKNMTDVLECKLFSIGVESYTVGSAEFYYSYAMKNKTGLCIDNGHFSPEDDVADKLSALSLFTDDILLHLTRHVRWDSDHVVIYNDELVSIMQEIKRNNLFNKVHIGLDYFDASINRILAYTVGIRSAQKAMLYSLLEPTHLIEKAEREHDYSARLLLSEEFKNLPFNAVYDYICEVNNLKRGEELLKDIRKYESENKR